MNVFYKILLVTVGGLITGIFIPLINYFMPRIINRVLLKKELIERKEGNYLVKNIAITNASLATLKNIYVHVTIDNEAKDIIQKTRFKTFTTDCKVDYGMLSWSKNIEGKNFPFIDLNQGETHQVNFIRLHGDVDQNAIEVASEQGFFEVNDLIVKSTSRIILRNNRDYNFKIKITGDNLCPKNYEINFNHISQKFN